MPAASSSPIVLTGDGSPTLFSEAYGQTFHSHHGALTECRHVFLAGSGIQERLKAGHPTRVLEVGLGTGMNFLLTAEAASASQTPLTYVAFEQTLLPAEALEAVYTALPLSPERANAFLTWRRSLEDTPAGLLRWQNNDTLALEILLGDATASRHPIAPVDAVYLDAFSPDANPELWTPAFLSRLFDVLKPGGRLTTYSAKGTVRRTLAACGFSVERLPGPPGKRHMVAATRPVEPSS